MTDRIKGYTVVLRKDLRENDAEAIQKAISMIKGVAKVEPSVVESDDHINRMKMAQRFKEKLDNFIRTLEIDIT